MPYILGEDGVGVAWVSAVNLEFFQSTDTFWTSCEQGSILLRNKGSG